MGGCATTGDRASPPADRNQREAAALHEEARAALAERRAEDAVRSLRRLEALHPTYEEATDAEMELVYAYHLADDPASAMGAAERFIRRHTDHPSLDYLYYLRALAAFAQANQALQQVRDLEPDAPGIRPPWAEVALEHLGDLLARFPDSRYGPDTRRRIEHLRLQLARIELSAAQYFLGRGDYANAGLRARALIDNYPDSGLAGEAAVVVNMAFRMLHLDGGAPLDVREKVRDATPDPAGPSTGRDGGLGTPDWIRAQSPGLYTIQLFSTSSEDRLRDFANRHQIRDLAWFRTEAAGKSWFSLVHGAFDSIDDARAAAERLPAALRVETPWIRRLGEVQALLE